MVSLLSYELWNLYSAARIFPPLQKTCSQIILTHYIQLSLQVLSLKDTQLSSILENSALFGSAHLSKDLPLSLFPFTGTVFEWMILYNLISSFHQSPEMDYFSSNGSNKNTFSNSVSLSLSLFPWSFWNKVFCFPPHFPYSLLPYVAFRLFSFYFFRQSSMSLTGFSSSPCSLISLYTGL